MAGQRHRVVFVDHLINGLFKSLERLKQDGYEVLVFNSEKELLDGVQENNPDVIFLNLDLRPNDAIALSNEIRNLHIESNPFHIIYSEKQEEFVQELAYNSGIDSFISFHSKPAILALYLKNLLRRKCGKQLEAYRNLYLDDERHLVYKDGQPFQLPRKEFNLFSLLYKNPEKFFSKAEIAEQIWQDGKVGNKRIIDVHIYNIRQLFGKRSIQSQKGKGYRFNSAVIR